MIKNSLVFILLAFVFLSCDTHTIQTTSSEIQQLSTDNVKSSSVYLTLNHHQVPVISWVESMEDGSPLMYYAEWDDAKDAFGKSRSIPIPENTSTHEEGMPKIAYKSDGTLMVIYESNTPVPGKRWGVTDLRYMKTLDNGKNWTASKTVIVDRNIEASQSFAGITQLGDGEIGVAWLDTYMDSTKKSRPVRFAKTNGKADFGQSVLLDEQACECCRVAVVGDEKGNISVAYRDLTDKSIRDISIANSKDNGQTFASPVDFSNNQWVVEGCPHNGPSLVKFGENTFATWFTGNEEKGVHFAKMNHQGKVLQKELVSSDGRFSQLITMTSGLPVITYCEDYRVGDSIYSRIKIAKYQDGKLIQKEISDMNSKAFYPVLRQLDEKNVIVGWKDQDRIFFKRVNIDF